KRDDAQLLVGCPLVPRSAGFRLGAAAENGGEARAGGSALGPAFERQSNLIALGRGSDPQLDVVIGRRRESRPRYWSAKFARQFANRGDLRQSERLTEGRARLGNPKQVADPGQQPGAKLTRSARDAKQSHEPSGVAGQQLIHRRINPDPGAASKELGDEANLALLRRGKDQIIAKAATFVQ